MKCVQCGTSNVNEMLVSFIAEDESGQGYEDITTFPNLLSKISNCETKTKVNYSFFIVFFNISILSIFSHVKSGSSLPKCPYAAVFL